MKYLKKFDTHTEYESFIESEQYERHSVSICVEEEHSHFDNADYSQRYLTFVALEDGTFKFSGNSVNYSLDNGETWVSLASNTDTPTVSAGSKIMWKATLVPQNSNGIGKFIYSGSFDGEGNPMSLLYGDDFRNKTSLEGNEYAFYCLFMYSNIVDASNLKLVATTLAKNCYQGMFWGCTSLTTAPELPATTLANNCYYGMFDSCTSLTTAPELPAMILADYCYSNMFYGCTSLTTAPVLSATTLATKCYQEMFRNCTSLTTAPELPATTLVGWCYSDMFEGCTSLTTAPELPATTMAEYCYYYMFRDCAKLTTAPELPATTMAEACYQYMFYGCKSLTTAPELPATTMVKNCYYGMFDGCTSLTTAPELPATTMAKACYCYMFFNCTSLTTGPDLPAVRLAEWCYGVMFSGCVNLNYIKMLATDISANNCLNGWTYNVSSSGTFVKNASMTNLPTGVNGIPEGWTVVNNG